MDQHFDFGQNKNETNKCRSTKRHPTFTKVRVFERHDNKQNGLYIMSLNFKQVRIIIQELIKLKLY